MRLKYSEFDYSQAVYHPGTPRADGQTSMSTAIRLPPELRAFLTLPGPQCLLIRGSPGSGKTALALTLLEGFSGSKLFVSGRVSPRELLREFPWAESAGVEIVDTVSSPGRTESVSTDIARPLHVRPPAPPPPSPVPERDPSWLPPSIREAWSRAEKARGADDSPSWVPPSLRAAWRRVDPNQPSIIVVDPWEAFVEEYIDAAQSAGGHVLDRTELERRLLRQVARGKSLFVMVVEREDPSSLDYLVNGVVHVRRGTFENHLDRWIDLPKLRGVRIEVGSYPFTMDGGRFQCIGPESTAPRPVRIASEPDPEPVPGTLWPGSSDFAKAFGRLPNRAMTLLETEPGVSDVVAQSLIFPIALSALKGGGRVFILPPPGRRILDIWEGFERALPDGVFPRQVRILLPGLTVPPDHPLAHSIVPVPTEAATFSVTPRARRAWEFITHPGKPNAVNLVFVAAEGLRALGRLTGADYTPENLPAIAQAYLTGEAPVHQLLLARTGGPLSDAIRLMASTHLRMVHRQGRTFLYGLNPVTPPYVMTLRSDERPYDLLRVV